MKNHKRLAGNIALRRLRRLLKSTYWYRLQRHRGTLLLVAGFAIANLYLNARKVESPPFYMWDLYSMPSAPVDTFVSYVLRYNGHKFFNRNTFLNRQSGTPFAYTIRKYTEFKRTGLQQSPFGTWPCDPETERRALAAYPAWLKTHIQSVTGETVHRIEILEVRAQYRPDSRLQTLGYTTILSE